MCITLFTIQVTKAEIDDLKLGRAIPSCVLEARPLVEPVPRLLHEITLIGVKSPYNKLTLRLSHSYLRRGTIAMSLAKYCSCIAKLLCPKFFMRNKLSYHKARQTKFTVYHHRRFDFACGQAVIIQISN